MSVDVKTLRIGSHIDFNGRRVKIKAIVEDSVAFDYTQDEKQLYLSPNAYDEFLSPIPITPELLKELGLKYRTPTCIWIKASEDEYLSFERICGTNRYRVHLYSGDIDRGKCVCRYIHEAEAFLALHDVELIPD